MSRFLFGAALLGAVALTGAMAGEAQAQFGPNPFGGSQLPSNVFNNGQSRGNTFGPFNNTQFGGTPFGGAPFGGTPTGNGLQGGTGTRNQGATLTLTPNIRKVVSIDAHNMLLAEVENADGSTQIIKMKVDHNYSGGMAKLFGGDVVPTLPFVTPGNFTNAGPSATGAGNGFGGNGMNNGLFGGSVGGGLGFTNGFNNGGFGPNTTVTGSGIFAPGR